nr:uncharacterized protein LOC128695554 isoform X1 [Cherax quadricarinatus]
MAKMRQIQVLMLRLVLMTALVLLLLSPYLLPRLHLPPLASLLKPQAPLPLSQTPAPPQQKTKEHHPVYDKSCYKYHANLTAENICCRATNFSDSFSVIHKCIIEANTHLLNKERSNSTGAKDGAVVGGNAAGGGGTAGRSELWSIFGDSHMRYLFASFLTRFRSPTLQYRLNAGEWLNGTELETFLHGDKLWQDIQMRDVKINFRMNYNFDKLLKKLPNKMAEWEENRPKTPTLVILGVYIIPCNDCNKLYVGETSRDLQTRISEHQYASRSDDTRNACVQHRNSHNHLINYRNSRLIATEDNTQYRRILESSLISISDNFNQNSGFYNIAEPLAKKLLHRYPT